MWLITLPFKWDQVLSFTLLISDYIAVRIQRLSITVHVRNRAGARSNLSQRFLASFSTMSEKESAKLTENETLTTDEADFGCTVSSEESVDSEYNSAEEELFEEGLDAVFDE